MVRTILILYYLHLILILLLAYDDLALNRRSSYYGTDLDYAVPYTSTPYTAGALTPSRSRRSSSVSFNTPLPGQQLSSSDYGSYGYDYRGRVPRIKFRSKYSNSGMSLSEAVNGVRPMGGDSYKWHDLHADRNGEIFLRVTVRMNFLFPGRVAHPALAL